MKTDYTYDRAFPKPYGSDGLTKLEYFAGLAMQGILAKHSQMFDSSANPVANPLVSEFAVQHAKLLIERLNKELE